MLGGGANRLGGRRPKGRTTMMMMPSSGQAVEFALGLEETVRDNDDRCCEEGKCCLEWSDLEEEEEEEEEEQRGSRRRDQGSRTGGARKARSADANRVVGPLRHQTAKGGFSRRSFPPEERERQWNSRLCRPRRRARGFALLRSCPSSWRVAPSLCGSAWPSSAAAPDRR